MFSGTNLFSSAKQSHRLLADIPIVSIVLVILGVPGKVLVIVHVEERLPFLGSLVEVGEGHGGACDPVETSLLHTSCPVHTVTKPDSTRTFRY